MKSSIKFTIALLGAVGLAACEGDSHTNNTPDAGGGADMSTVTPDGGSGDDGGNTLPDGGDTPDGTVIAADMGPDDSTPDELTLDELPTAIAEVFCAHPECFVGDATFFRLFTGDTSGEGCVTRFASVLAATDLLIPHAAIADGLVNYDPAAAQTCVDSVRETATCETLFGEGGADASCATRLFVGTVEAGGACPSGGGDFGGDAPVCVTGATCVRSGSLPRPCDGVCMTEVANGEPCVDGGECVTPDGYDYSYCGTGDFDGTRCIAVRRVSLEAGDPCSGGSVRDGFLETNSYCASGLSCLLDGDGPGYTCQAGGGGGDERECDDATPCADAGDICMEGRCTGFEINGLGGACGFDEEAIRLCDIGAGLACSIDFGGSSSIGECIAVGDGTAGAICSAVAGQLGAPGGCNAGMYCDVMTREFPGLEGTCATLLADDAECSDNEECESGYCYMNACRPLVCEG